MRSSRTCRSQNSRVEPLKRNSTIYLWPVFKDFVFSIVMNGLGVSQTGSTQWKTYTLSVFLLDLLTAKISPASSSSLNIVHTNSTFRTFRTVQEHFLWTGITSSLSLHVLILKVHPAAFVGICSKPTTRSKAKLQIWWYRSQVNHWSLTEGVLVPSKLTLYWRLKRDLYYRQTVTSTEVCWCYTSWIQIR